MVGRRGILQHGIRNLSRVGLTTRGDETTLTQDGQQPELKWHNKPINFRLAQVGFKLDSEKTDSRGRKVSLTFVRVFFGDPSGFGS